MLVAPFVAFYTVLLFIALALVFGLLWVGVIRGVFETLGLPPQEAFLALIAALIGSYINIPIARLECGELHSAQTVSAFGVRYRVPARSTSGSTVLAINVGGAIVPVLISIYVMIHNPEILSRAILGALVVAMIVNRFAKPIRGMGIATPMFIPPIAAAIMAWLLTGVSAHHHADAVAFVSGVIGTLVGADLMNLGKLRELGAPVASIGGAGTFDGIFLTGLFAVLLA